MCIQSINNEGSTILVTLPHRKYLHAVHLLFMNASLVAVDFSEINFSYTRKLCFYTSGMVNLPPPHLNIISSTLENG